MSRVFFIVIFHSLIYLQPTKEDFELLETGRLNEAKERVNIFKSESPYDPGTIYYEILLNLNGDSTISLLRQYVIQYENSEYADDAEMKVGEYLYSRGLYSQSSQHLKKMILKYPKSIHQERAIEMMVSSFTATGEKDSVQYYLKKFKKLDPTLEINNIELPVVELQKPSPINKKTVVAQLPIKKDLPFVIQVGAFSRYDNAKRLSTIVSSSGYETDIVEVASNGSRLHAVRVGRFATKEEAEKIGEDLHNDLGLNFRVLKRE